MLTGVLGGSVAPLAKAPVELPLLVGLIGLLTFGLFKLNMHLGKPHRFYRGFNNLRWSPVSREIAGISGFYGLLLGYALLAPFAGAWVHTLQGLVGGGAAASGLAGLYFMYRIYRVPARPFWNHWQTATAFGGNALTLGSVLAGAVALPALALVGGSGAAVAGVLAGIVALGQAIEIAGHLGQARAVRRVGRESSVSWFLQTTRYYWPWVIRNALLGVNVVAGLALMAAVRTGLDGWLLAGAWLVLGSSATAAAVIGRSLFFVVVIPTTMPGAFFWKNQDFVEHARQTGLADLEQVGVVREHHGQFKWEELWATVRATRPRDLVRHVREILVWQRLPGERRR